MSKDGISRTDAPRDAALRTAAWVLGTLRAGTVGCAVGKNRPAPDDSTVSRRLSPAGHPVRNALPLYSHVAGSFKTLWHQLNFC